MQEEVQELREKLDSLKEDKEELETANDLLQTVINKERYENNSQILALKIDHQQTQDAFKVAESARLTLEEKNSTLFKI